MTKEQILEKIEVPPVGDGAFKTTAIFPDVERLTSYLATIEERLEKLENEDNCDICGIFTPTQTEGETKHRCSTKCRVDCKLRAPTPTPTDKQDCGTLSNSGGITNTPTEVKDGCPPHNLIDFHFAGMWGGSTPPPNKKCTKCLIELYF